MKLTGHTAKNFFINPSTNANSILLHGPSGSHVLYKRKVLQKAISNRNSLKGLQTVTIDAAELRIEPSKLIDEVKSSDLFFNGERIIFLENATDTIFKGLSSCLDQMSEGDPQIIITAGNLNTKSKLRQYIESSKNSYSIAIYNDGLNIDEIKNLLLEKKITVTNDDVIQTLLAYVKYSDPLIFIQYLEKLSLYCLNSKVTSSDVEIIFSSVEETEVKNLVQCIISGNKLGFIREISVLESRGKNLSSITYNIANYFRLLHRIESHSPNSEEAFKYIWPPLFGAAKTKAITDSKKWGVYRLERALKILTSIDYKIRTSSKAPVIPIIEQRLLEICSLISIRDLHS